MKQRKAQRVGWMLSFLVALSLPAMGQVIVNEVAWSGTAISSSDEWIELRNLGEEDVDLTGWTLRIGDRVIHLGGVEGATKDVRATTILGLGHFLLERTDDETVPGIAADLLYTGGLANAGEDLVLIDGAGNEVDRVLAASDGWPAGTSGSDEPAYASMERYASPLDGRLLWGTYEPEETGAEIQGTPGAPNRADLLASRRPWVEGTRPMEGSIAGSIDVEWIAIDPDGDDSRLSIDVFLHLVEDESEVGEPTLLASHLANTGRFAWDTSSTADGTYRLVIRASDGEYEGVAQLGPFELKNDS